MTNLLLNFVEDMILRQLCDGSIVEMKYKGSQSCTLEFCFQFWAQRGGNIVWVFHYLEFNYIDMMKILLQIIIICLKFHHHPASYPSQTSWSCPQFLFSYVPHQCGYVISSEVLPHLSLFPHPLYPATASISSLYPWNSFYTTIVKEV